MHKFIIEMGDFDIKVQLDRITRVSKCFELSSQMSLSHVTKPVGDDLFVFCVVFEKGND